MSDLPKHEIKKEKGYKDNRDDFTLSQIIPLGLSGLKDTNNYMNVFNPEAEHPVDPWGETKIFNRDREGNMKIAYWTIDGESIIYYDNTLKNPKPKTYETVRLAEPKGDMKYKMPKGQGALPWYHPYTVQAYKDGTEIDTIYLTEGVKKAFIASQNGHHVIGLASITCYADSDKRIHKGIRDLIRKCKVKNVVVLWDGDCTHISSKAIHLREESTKRVFGFFNSAKNIRKLVLAEKLEEDPRIFFMHVKSEYWKADQPKGLDDLLITARASNKMDAVLKDMSSLDEAGAFFYRTEITKTTSILFKYFLLNDVTQFYFRHAHVIGETEFVYKGDLYQYTANEEVKLLQPGWAERIFFVGNDYFEEVLVPSARKEFYTKRLEPRKIGTLSARFPKGWQKYLNYYQSFVCIPNHLSNYERIIEVGENLFINKYHPFPHVPKAGKIDNIMKFLKHIFGQQIIIHPKTGQKIPSYEMGLDYMQQLMMNPLQPLPVVMLYSPENQTGKSTFTELCYRMFGDNTVFVSNSDLQSEFNAPFIGKLLIMCEETVLERRKEADKIKNNTTATRVTANEKGVSQYTADWFAKYIFCTNVERMIYMNQHDDRYWIIRVPAIAKKDLDPGLKARLWAEIPAFVEFLSNRKMFTENEGRMWFNPDLLLNEARARVVQINEPSIATDTRFDILDMFLKDDALQVLEMPIRNVIKEFMPKGTSVGYAIELISNYLGAEQLKKEDKLVQKRGSYTITESGMEEMHTRTVKWHGRPWLFKRENFIKQEYVKEDGHNGAFPTKRITEEVPEGSPF